MTITTATPTCRTTHQGDCTALVTPTSVIVTIEQHGIATRKVQTVAGLLVEAYDPRLGEWVSVPRTMHGLAVWLGY